MDSPLVKAEFHSMARVSERNAANLQTVTRRLLHHDIPAFILRSSVQIVPQTPLHERIAHYRQAHVRHAELLKTLLWELHPDLEPVIQPVPLDNLSQSKTGWLHLDTKESIAEHPCDVVTEPNIHTTLAGGGRVLVAHIGTDAPLAYRFGSDDPPLPYDDPDEPHNALLHGMVDPRVVERQVYTGMVKPGDSVVSAGDSGCYATWHRYDTNPAFGARSVEASRLQARECFNPPVGYDLGV